MDENTEVQLLCRLLNFLELRWILIGCHVLIVHQLEKVVLRVIPAILFLCVFIVAIELEWLLELIVIVIIFGVNGFWF